MKITFDNFPTSTVRKSGRHNNAVGSSVEVSPDQLGVNITKSIFGWRTAPSGVKAPTGADMGSNTAASSWIDKYGLPFIFVVNGNQILLPPIVRSSGSVVPYLPDGLTVQWAASFMGVAIPSDMLRPVCKGGNLFLNATEIATALKNYPPAPINGSLWGAASVLEILSSPTAEMLISWPGTTPGKSDVLLRLLMSVMECLIYSYSSYPWGNDMVSLANGCMQNRAWPNWLIYPSPQNSGLGNFLTDVAPVYKSVIAPVVATVLPAVGSAINNAVTTAINDQLPGVTDRQNASNVLTTSVVPSGEGLVDQYGNPIPQSGITVTGINPLILIAAVVLIIILILK